MCIQKSEGRCWAKKHLTRITLATSAPAPQGRAATAGSKDLIFWLEKPKKSKFNILYQTSLQTHFDQKIEFGHLPTHFRTPRTISYDPQLIFEISSKIDFFDFLGPRKSQLSIFISKKNSIEFRKIIFSEFCFRPIGHLQFFASRLSSPKHKKTPAVQKS